MKETPSATIRRRLKVASGHHGEPQYRSFNRTSLSLWYSPRMHLGNRAGGHAHLGCPKVLVWRHPQLVIVSGVPGSRLPVCVTGSWKHVPAMLNFQEAV